jgi:hypothetical protein
MDLDRSEKIKKEEEEEGKKNVFVNDLFVIVVVMWCIIITTQIKHTPAAIAAGNAADSVPK